MSDAASPFPNDTSAAADLRSWVPDRAGIDHNVLIVGGGQNGCAFAFALSRAGIGKVSVIDAAADEHQAGVWLTRARMRRLRTPKSVGGPELGFPDLSFRTWYEENHGAEAYDVFDRVGRTDWADYLRWYRSTLGIPVRYGVSLKEIEPVGSHFRVHLDIAGTATVETVRKIVLATGVSGSGRPNIPALLAGLPRSHTAHTADFIDFDSFRGKDVAVIGAAASAFDAAAVALEHGAKSVHQFVRRPYIASIPVYRNRFYPGAYEHYANLPDAVRWRQALRGHESGSTPPVESVDRVARFPNYHLHLNTAWDDARLSENQIEARVRDELFRFHFAIAGTGYGVDLKARPELARIVDSIRLWGDQYVPPSGQEDAKLAGYPYLGLAHEFLEKVPGFAPYLRNIHVYNPGGYLSFGLPTGDLWTMRRDVPIISKRIGLDLFLEDVDHHDARMSAPVSPEFGIERYASAIWRGKGEAAPGAAEKPRKARILDASARRPANDIDSTAIDAQGEAIIQVPSGFSAPEHKIALDTLRDK